MSVAFDNPLAAKLGNFTRFSRTDRIILDSMAQGHVRQCAARRNIVAEGDEPLNVRLFLTGWACRHKMLEDGRRQIVAFLLPGDLCDLHVFVLRSMDHTVSALTKVTYAEISHQGVSRITATRPRITQALLWSTMVDNAIQREWALNLGQRSALERVAHLLCELFIRLSAVGLVVDGSCWMPVTQADLGEATGLSTVHVNRTLQELRTRGLIGLEARMLSVPDLSALKAAAAFNSNYLHLDHEGSNLDAHSA